MTDYAITTRTADDRPEGLVKLVAEFTARGFDAQTAATLAFAAARVFCEIAADVEDENPYDGEADDLGERFGWNEACRALKASVDSKYSD
jgi:hypothetical protein